MPHRLRTDLRHWRLLLVEDDEDDYVITRDLLNETPDVTVAIDWCRDFDEARSVIEERRHDLFLFDYRLGEVTGVELLRETRARGVRTPVILLTGHASHDRDIEAMRAGAADYIPKAELSAQTLERAIRYALERKHAEDTLRQLSEELERRVAERTAELQEKNRELETFTYSVSHDLKAPLRGIDGYSRLLLEDHAASLNDEGRRFLGTIRGAVTQMNALIDDLLAYSRLERRSLVTTAVDPRPFVDELLSERAEEIRACGAVVRAAVPPGSLLVDPEGLAQALRNLLDNALKFTRGARPPTVDVTGAVGDATYTLSVRDNGIGFDMAYHDHIFGIFQRLHRAEEYPGTGVGLALVAKAARRMGGRAWAESAPGAGATFHLELPREASR